MQEYEDLLTAAGAFPKVSKRHFVFFSKGGYTAPVRARARREGAILLALEDLYSLNADAWKRS